MIMGSPLLDSQFLALSLFFNYQATGYESEGTVGVGQSKEVRKTPPPLLVPSLQARFSLNTGRRSVQ